MSLGTIIFTVVFCGLMIAVIYTSLVMSSRADECYNEDLDTEETCIHKETLKRIKQYIEKKNLNAWRVDVGMSSDRSDRLMTETVVELQIIESMIDEVMTYDDYEEGLLD